MHHKISENGSLQTKNLLNLESTKHSSFLDRNVQKESSSNHPMTTRFNSSANESLKQLIIQRSIEVNNSFQIMIHLRQVNTIFAILIDQMLSLMISKQRLPKLASTDRFPILKSDQNTIPACFTTDLHKTLTLYFHTLKNLDQEDCLDYKNIFEHHLNLCTTQWQSSDAQQSPYDFDIDEPNNCYTIILFQENLILNTNNKQQSYLLNCFLEKLFSNKNFIEDSDCINVFKHEKAQKIFTFINFLNKYKLFENINKTINYIIYSCRIQCLHLNESVQTKAIEFFQKLLDLNLLHAELAKTLLPSIVPIIAAEDQYSDMPPIHAQEFLQNLVKAQLIHPKELLDQIIGLFNTSKKRVLEKILSFLSTLSKEQLIPKEMVEVLLVPLISLLDNNKLKMQNEVLACLTQFANEHLMDLKITEKIFPHVLPKLQDSAWKTLNNAAIFISTLTDCNLVNEKMSKELYSIIPIAHHSLAVQYCALKILESLVNANFIDKTIIEKALPLAIPMLSHPNWEYQYLALKFLESLTLVKLIRKVALEKILPLILPMLEHNHTIIQDSALKLFENLVDAYLINQTDVNTIGSTVLIMLNSPKWQIQFNSLKLLKCFVKAALMSKTNITKLLSAVVPLTNSSRLKIQLEAQLLLELFINAPHSLVHTQ